MELNFTQAIFKVDLWIGDIFTFCRLTLVLLS